MTATTSIIKNFHRVLNNVSYATYINIPEIVRAFKESLSYHTEVLTTDVYIDHGLYNKCDKEYILELEQARAIRAIAEELVKNKRVFKITEEADVQGIKIRYELNVLIDRGF